jgi:hypothetical protein
MGGIKMAKQRALKDVARDPLAKKEIAVPKEKDAELQRGIGHYALTITIGLVAGVIGGLLSSRILKII